MKSKLVNIDYPEYIDYLNSSGINSYTEETYIDDCLAFEEVIEVTPISNRLKPRKFSTDGGWQMFDGVDYFKEFLNY